MTSFRVVIMCWNRFLRASSFSRCFSIRRFSILSTPSGPYMDFNMYGLWTRTRRSSAVNARSWRGGQVRRVRQPVEVEELLRAALMAHDT